MSPDARAALTALSLLRTEFQANRQGMERRFLELSGLLGRWEMARTEYPWQVVAAVALHAWFTALESALERVGRTLDRTVPAGPRSHVTLLAQCAVEVPGVRPALYAAEHLRDLEELLKFRHFFRHAYDVQLDPVLLEAEARRVARLHPQLSASLDAFDQFLAKAIEDLAKLP